MTYALLLQAVPESSWQEQALMMVLTTLSAIATGAVPVLLLWLRKKLKLDVDAKTQERLSQLAISGIQWAEEQAGKCLKDKLPRPSSKGKLDSAMGFVVGEMQRLKLPQMAADEVQKLIESHLPVVREPGKPPEVPTEDESKPAG